MPEGTSHRRLIFFFELPDLQHVRVHWDCYYIDLEIQAFKILKRWPRRFLRNALSKSVLSPLLGQLGNLG